VSRTFRFLTNRQVVRVQAQDPMAQGVDAAERIGGKTGNFRGGELSTDPGGAAGPSLPASPRR